MRATSSIIGTVETVTGCLRNPLDRPTKILCNLPRPPSRHRPLGPHLMSPSPGTKKPLHLKISLHDLPSYSLQNGYGTGDASTIVLHHLAYRCKQEASPRPVADPSGRHAETKLSLGTYSSTVLANASAVMHAKTRPPWISDV